MVILALMTAASRVIPENGTSSVIHSRTVIANENVSEFIVVGTLFPSMTSGAVYLTHSERSVDHVSEFTSAPLSSMIFVIPKSQIRGSPLPTHGQLIVRRTYCVNDKLTSWEISTFFYATSVGGLSREGRVRKTHAFNCWKRVKSRYTRQISGVGLAIPVYDALRMEVTQASCGATQLNRDNVRLPFPHITRDVAYQMVFVRFRVPLDVYDQASVFLPWPYLRA